VAEPEECSAIPAAGRQSQRSGQLPAPQHHQQHFEIKKKA